MIYTEQDLEFFVESLYQEHGTSEEVLKHLNNEIDKQVHDEFYFDTPTYSFDFLNKARKYISNKAKFQ